MCIRLFVRLFELILSAKKSDFQISDFSSELFGGLGRKKVI